jgi:hypothetical protein
MGRTSKGFNIRTTLDQESAAHKIATHEYSTEGIAALMQIPPNGITRSLSSNQFKGHDPVKYLREDNE